MQIIFESRDSEGAQMRDFSLAPDWRTALDRALGRATRMIRILQRSQKPVRDRTAKLALGG